MDRTRLFLLCLLGLLACGTGRKFVAVPSELDPSSVPHQSIEITAERFHFTPEEVRVKEGTLLTLHVTSLDGTHGFKLGEFGIDETIEKGGKTSVRLFASQRGEYTFSCSHFCGLGHFWMSGKLIVE